MTGIDGVTGTELPDEADDDTVDDDEVLPGDEGEFDREQIIRAKWVMDEAKTLTDAVGKLCAFAGWLVTAERCGWQLREPVGDDYGFIDPPSAIAAPESEWTAGANEPLATYAFCGVAMHVAKPYGWICRNHRGVIWQASVSERLAGTTCPVCATGSGHP